MSAADSAVLDMGIIDATSVDLGADTSVDTDSGVDTSVDTSVGDVENEVESGGQDTDAEHGTEDSEQGGEKGASPAPVRDKEVAEYLKNLKAENPRLAKALRDSYFGQQAFQKEFKSIKELQSFKSFIAEHVPGADWKNPDSVVESIQNLTATVQSVQETDAAVLAGDPSVVSQVLQDCLEARKPESFAKLGEAFLEQMRNTPELSDYYYDAVREILVSSFNEVGLPRALNSIGAYLENGNTEGARKVLAEVAQWYNSNVYQPASQKIAQKSEGAKISAERARWEQERSQQERTTLKTTVATEAERVNNQTLGAELKSYLALPFFKTLPLTTKQDLARGIKAELYERLQNDKSYQKQMTSLFGAKSPSKDSILNVHSNLLKSIAADVVKTVIEKRYPNYAKGGSAAGRVAAAKAKSDAGAKAAQRSINDLKPIYVATKPTNLVRDSITVGGKEYSKSDLEMLMITGKGFTKGMDGKLRFVTWRKN